MAEVLLPVFIILNLIQLGLLLLTRKQLNEEKKFRSYWMRIDDDNHRLRQKLNQIRSQLARYKKYKKKDKAP